MKEEVKKFLESGKIEEYLMGTCDEATLKEVEYFIENYPEVKAEYEDLQDKIEESASKMGIDPPNGLEEAIISCLNEDSDYQTKSNLRIRRKSSSLRFLPWAAAILAFVFTAVLWNQNIKLEDNLAALNRENHNLKRDINYNEQEIANLENQLFISSHNASARVFLTGNDLSPDFQSTAFWNPVAKKAILYINDLSLLEGKNCYQAWADVNGEMINLGVLPHKKGLIELPFLENAESINITIEPKGGSEHPTVENLITSQQLIKI